MPLSVSPCNIEMKVVKILADDKLKRHLESLGIAVGSMIRVLNMSGGSVVLQIKDGRLALDRDLATKILVA